MENKSSNEEIGFCIFRYTYPLHFIFACTYMEPTSKNSLITLQISVKDLQKIYLVCAVSVVQQLLVAMG